MVSKLKRYEKCEVMACKGLNDAITTTLSRAQLGYPAVPSCKAGMSRERWCKSFYTSGIFSFLCQRGAGNLSTIPYYLLFTPALVNFPAVHRSYLCFKSSINTITGRYNIYSSVYNMTTKPPITFLRNERR